MKNKGPSPDELSLWQQAMRDVKRLFGAADPDTVRQKEPPSKPKAPVSVPKSPLRPFIPDIRLTEPDAPSARNLSDSGMDRRTEDKFRKGKMAIDGRLDLHGLTLNEAHQRVREYILLQHAAGKRCLLIITGKGSRGGSLGEPPRGQIRQSLGHWLSDPDLKPLILSMAPAQIGHGGDGAFYVLLRRQRN